MFECGHWRYWYLGDQVLAQVQHMHLPEMIPAHPCHSISLADLLANEEIACAWIGRTVLGTPGDYLEFVQAHLQGCLADIFGASVSFFLFQINLHHDLYHFYFAPL